MSVLLLACGAAEAKLNVVATVPDLGELTRKVGGDQVNVTVLARATQDPHFVDPRPNLVLDASRAQVLVLNGVGLEAGWLPPVLDNSRNAAIQPGQPGYIDASTFVQLLEIPKGTIDRSMGDIHPGGNPHYTLNPRNALLVARGIARRLSQIDPAHEKVFTANLAAFEKALTPRIEAWEKALAPFKGTDVVTYHKSWIYFTEWAGLDEVAFVEPKPGIPPSAGHVAQVLGVMKQRKVPVILQEEWYPAATSEQLARLSGAKVVRVPGQTREGQSYIDHIDQVVSETVKALSAGK
jgi:zinc/manganese transport system substrate-binding protein